MKILDGRPHSCSLVILSEYMARLEVPGIVA